MESLGKIIGDGKAGKRRKREAVKRASNGAGKEKVTYYLSEEAIQRVGIAATMEKKSHSSVIEDLITAHLRRWVVSCRGQRADVLAEEEAAGQGEV